MFVDQFNTGFRPRDVYMYMLVLLWIYYIDDVFNTIFFCDAPLGGYFIYVILHDAYGRTYVDAA